MSTVDGRRPQPGAGAAQVVGRAARSPAARLVVLVSGGGTNLQAVLDACAAGHLPAEVALVVSNRRAAPALERAAAAGVPTAHLALKPVIEAGGTRRDYDGELARLVAGARPDWVVLAGWMHVLSSAFLDHFPERVVNLHPALPGAFPGANAIDDAWAAYGRGQIDRTGVMIHLVPDEGVDRGPVLAAVEVPILPGDSRDTLEARIHDTEHELLVATLARLVAAVAAPPASPSDRPADAHDPPRPPPVPFPEAAP
jgi:formyltetrahydrofolate-dependent phosphoribosylglycinamide formyltransferase